MRDLEKYDLVRTAEHSRTWYMVRAVNGNMVTLVDDDGTAFEVRRDSIKADDREVREYSGPDPDGNR